MISWLWFRIKEKINTKVVVMSNEMGEGGRVGSSSAKGGRGGEYSRGKDKQTIKTNIFKGSLKHI